MPCHAVTLEAHSSRKCVLQIFLQPPYHSSFMFLKTQNKWTCRERERAEQSREHTVLSFDFDCLWVSSDPRLDQSSFAPHPDVSGSPTASSSTTTISAWLLSDFASGTCNANLFIKFAGDLLMFMYDVVLHSLKDQRNMRNSREDNKCNNPKNQELNHYLYIILLEFGWDQ